MKSYIKHHLNYILNEELTELYDQWKVEDNEKRKINSKVDSKVQETPKVKIPTPNENKKFGKLVSEMISAS